jgi:hypothetical protein
MSARPVAGHRAFWNENFPASGRAYNTDPIDDFQKPKFPHESSDHNPVDSSCGARDGKPGRSHPAATPNKEDP